MSLREDTPEPGIDVCAPGSLTGQIDPGLSRMAGSLAAADAEGRFTLEPLEPGWYTVRAGGGAVESAPVRLAPGQVLGLRLVSVMSAEGEHGTLYRQAEIAAGENRLDLVLPDPAVIRGRVLRPDGGPAAAAG